MSQLTHPTRFIGQVIKQHAQWKAVRVRVQELKRHEYLNMYYQKRVHYWAADPEGTCKDGDIVQIKELEEPQSERVKHFVKDFVFQVGNIIDPVTGRRCRGPEYINEDLRRFGPGQENLPEDVKLS